MKDGDFTWFEQAICAGKTELFFPPNGVNEGKRERIKRERLAESVCQMCPIIDKCKQHARDHGELGFWGGETEEQRYLAGYLRNSVVIRRLRYAKNNSLNLALEKEKQQVEATLNTY